MQLLVGLALGLGAGVLSGLLGIGGGVIIVPALVVFLGFTTQRAVGTSLAALLLPVGLFAVLRYARADTGVSFAVAAALALGLTVGATAGSLIATRIDSVTLGRLFGVLLLVLGVRFVVKGG